MKPEKDKQLAFFDVWFYLFGAFTVILIAFFQSLTVEAGFTFSLMIWVKQLANGYKENLRTEERRLEDERVSSELEKLRAKIKTFDPYPD